MTMAPKETLIKPSSVIPSEAELPVFGQFREVEEPAFVLCELNQSFPQCGRSWCGPSAHWAVCSPEADP